MKIYTGGRPKDPRVFVRFGKWLAPVVGKVLKAVK